jgi:iron complex transport system ATP-binding protein
MSEHPTAASFQEVCFRYRPMGAPVLSDVCLEIPSRAVTAILGPNGSGKTTLLHLLIGLLTPVAGQIAIDGAPQSRYSRRELSHLLGLVSQSETITFELSVLEYVLLGRAPYLNLLERPGNEDRRVALEGLEMAGAGGLRDRPVTELSGGELQLVTIARALAQTPCMLLLDEPTSHLDLGNKRRVLNVLRNVVNEGRSVVLTTHDPNAAASVADYVVLLRDGEVLAAGPTEGVFTSDNLSAAYGTEVEVLRVNGRPVVVNG